MPLPGGNLTRVLRDGDVVRRTAGPWTPSVHRLLTHLRARGCSEVPVPLGVDGGEERLGYIEGEAGSHPLAPSLAGDATLVASARLLRRLHDASLDFDAGSGARWRVPPRAPAEVVCHGDYAPYNLVFARARPVGVIDFDYAHPAPRLWDVAYAAYRFAPLTAAEGPPVEDQVRRVALFCAGYGLEQPVRVIDSIVERLWWLIALIETEAGGGDQGFARALADGHADGYARDSDHVERHRAALERALDADGAGT